MSNPGRASLVEIGAFRGDMGGTPVDVTWELYDTDRWLLCVQGEGVHERTAGQSADRLADHIVRLDPEEARFRELSNLRTGTLVRRAVAGIAKQRLSRYTDIRPQGWGRGRAS